MKEVGEVCEGVMGDMREKEREAGEMHLGRMTTAFCNAFVQTRKRHFTRQIRSPAQSQYLHFSELRVPLGEEKDMSSLYLVIFLPTDTAQC